MIRVPTPARPHWQARNEEIGFHHHTPGIPYWTEDAAYRLSLRQAEGIERASLELNRICLMAAERISGSPELMDRLAIPRAFQGLVRRSWERDDPTIYGRLDLAYSGDGPPLLLEYNADTPVALLEASVAQWVWLEDVLPGRDQLNSIHERLLEQLGFLRVRRGIAELHLASARGLDTSFDWDEDRCTVHYLADVAGQAGIRARTLFVEDIGWDAGRARFLDEDENEIRNLFKLYPWEWLAGEAFGAHLPDDPVLVIEPAWKMTLSNKGLLAVLWDMFPGHPNLLPAFFEPNDRLGGRFVRKPLLSREGANVEIHTPGSVERSPGSYGREGFVYQQYAPLPEFDGRFPVVGSWIVGDAAAGIGIREGGSRITDNTSRFVPHFVDG